MVRIWHMVVAVLKLFVLILLGETYAFVGDHALLRPTISTGAHQYHGSSRCVNMLSHPDGDKPELATRRRAFVKAAGATAFILGLVGTAPTESQSLNVAGFELPLGGKEVAPEQAQVLKVASYSQLVAKVENDLRTGELQGGEDDSAVVVRVLDIYLKPMQEAMLAVAPQMTLPQEQSKDRVKLLPLLMKGHLLELEAACQSKQPKEQLREMEEVRETLDEFIDLAKTKYDVKSPPTAPSEEEFGIFGCNFYGMKRVDGTNTCQPDP